MSDGASPAAAPAPGTPQETAPPTSTDPVAFGTPRGRWVLLATILGSGIAALDATVVNVALPAIGEDLDASFSGLQWTLNGYLLALASLILLGGALGDRYGRRKVFVVGVVWFAVASLLCGVAPNVGVLVGARSLQGIGGALLTPGSLAIIQASFRPGDRARAIGAWSGLGAIATAVGPFAGGYLVDAVSWRWIFLLNLPLAVIVVLVAVRHVPETTDPDGAGHIDSAGALLGAIGLGGPTYALIEAREQGINDPQVLGALVVGVAALVGFLVLESRKRHPLLPLSIFSSRQFSAANVVTLTVYAAIGGVMFLLTVTLQQVLDYSPLEAGAAFFPVTLLMLGLSARAGALAGRIGPRLPMTMGPALMALALLLMTRIDAGTTYWATVLPAAVVFGLGIASTVAPLTATVLAAADERHAGVASGVNNAVARVAGLVAIAGLPVVAGISGDDYQDPVAFAEGFDVALLVAAGLALVGAAIAWFTISNDLDIAQQTEPDESPSHCALEAPPLRQPVAARSAKLAS